MTTGEPLVVRVAMKPISTLMRPLATVEMKTGEAASAVAERSDVTAVPAMGVIAEAMLAFVVAQAVIENSAAIRWRDASEISMAMSQQIAEKRGEPERLTSSLLACRESGRPRSAGRGASELHWPFIDFDTEIEHREHASVAEIFATKGEAYFRGLEQALTRGACQPQGNDYVGGRRVDHQPRVGGTFASRPGV